MFLIAATAMIDWAAGLFGLNLDPDATLRNLARRSAPSLPGSAPDAF
jgi:hypothetical protein